MFGMLLDTFLMQFRTLGATLFDTVGVLALFFLADLWALVAPLIGQA